MVSAVYTPDGIVISTLDFDNYIIRTTSRQEDCIKNINIVGHSHVITFWNKYAMLYHQMDCYRYNSSIKQLLHSVMQRWGDKKPSIYELMPYIKKAIIDNNIDIIGVMGGYSKSRSGQWDPYVYQILGTDIRRINANQNGEINYNCVFLEKETCFGRLLRDVRVKNGDDWEDLEPVNIRCDLFSLEKALDLSKFILDTAHYINNINTSESTKYRTESVLITLDNITVI